MTDPTDPPRKQKRAKRPEPDYAIDPNKPNATIELETADLVSLATKSRELQVSSVEKLRGATPPTEQNVFVDLGGEPEAIEPPKQQAMPAPPRASTPVNLVAPRAPRASSPLPQEHRISDSIPVTAPRGSKPMPAQSEPKPRADVTPAVRVESRPITSELRPKRGLGLVLLVYVIAAAALATSIYFRWFA